MTAPLERRAPSGSGGKSSVAGDSTVTQDYLKVVWAACEWGGAGASVTGLAKRMEVAPSTASENVARLVEEGLLVHEPYKAVTLSEEGRRRAMGMIRRHRILETYLVTRLGFGWDEVHAEAEELEHAVSERLLERLDSWGTPPVIRTGIRSPRPTVASSCPTSWVWRPCRWAPTASSDGSRTTPRRCAAWSGPASGWTAGCGSVIGAP